MVSRSVNSFYKAQCIVYIEKGSTFKYFALFDRTWKCHGNLRGLTWSHLIVLTNNRYISVRDMRLRPCDKMLKNGSIVLVAHAAYRPCSIGKTS